MLQSIVLRTQKKTPTSPDVSELYDGTVAQLGSPSRDSVQYGSVDGTQISLCTVFNSIFLNWQRLC